MASGSRTIKADAEQRWAQAQTIEQHQLQKLIALRIDCHANSHLGSFGETERAGRSGIIQGACNCALKAPRVRLSY